MEGRGPGSGVLRKEGRVRRLDDVLYTPEMIRNLWKKLYVEAKSGARMPHEKPVREPDAGNLQVRFDEREVETEHGLRLFGTGDAKGPANGKSLA